MNSQNLENYVNMLHRLVILYDAVSDNLKNLVKDNIVMVLTQIADFVAESLLKGEALQFVILSKSKLILTIDFSADMMKVEMPLGNSDTAYVLFPLGLYRFSTGG